MIKFANSDVVNYIVQTVKNLLQGYVKKEDIIDNLTSEDTDKPLAANQGEVLKDGLDKLQNQIHTEFNVPAGGAIELHVPNQRNLMLFYTHMVLPEYKSITFASAGNGNNTNIGQTTTLFKIVESQKVTLSVRAESGYYNNIIITNTGEYAAQVLCTVFGGTLPTLVN